jgi:hypothetical protein
MPNAQLLVALYSVRSERRFSERLDYDLMFRLPRHETGRSDRRRGEVTKNRHRLVGQAAQRVGEDGRKRSVLPVGDGSAGLVVVRGDGRRCPKDRERRDGRWRPGLAEFLGS